MNSIIAISNNVDLKGGKGSLPSLEVPTLFTQKKYKINKKKYPPHSPQRYRQWGKGGREGGGGGGGIYPCLNLKKK